MPLGGLDMEIEILDMGVKVRYIERGLMNTVFCYCAEVPIFGSLYT